ncbi:hypothetical protein MTO96_013221 [Rhipicephalus appendiculatus]
MAVRHTESMRRKTSPMRTSLLGRSSPPGDLPTVGQWRRRRSGAEAYTSARVGLSSSAPGWCLDSDFVCVESGALGRVASVPRLSIPVRSRLKRRWRRLQQRWNSGSCVPTEEKLPKRCSSRDLLAPGTRGEIGRRPAVRPVRGPRGSLAARSLRSSRHPCVLAADKSASSRSCEDSALSEQGACGVIQRCLSLFCMDTDKMCDSCDGFACQDGIPSNPMIACKTLRDVSHELFVLFDADRVRSDFLWSASAKTGDDTSDEGGFEGGVLRKANRRNIKEWSTSGREGRKIAQATVSCSSFVTGIRKDNLA